MQDRSQLQQLRISRCDLSSGSASLSELILHRLRYLNQLIFINVFGNTTLVFVAWFWKFNSLRKIGGPFTCFVNYHVNKKVSIRTYNFLHIHFNLLRSNNAQRKYTDVCYMFNRWLKFSSLKKSRFRKCPITYSWKWFLPNRERWSSTIFRTVQYLVIEIQNDQNLVSYTKTVLILRPCCAYQGSMQICRICAALQSCRF